MNGKNLRTNQLWLLIPAVLLAVVWAASPLFVSKASDSPFFENSVTTFLQAPLSGSPIGSVNPFGRSEYKVFSNNARRLEVEVFSVNLPANTQLDVFVNNVNVGRLTINFWRSGELTLDTTRGNAVPTVQAGQTVVLKNGGAIVLSGSFVAPTSPSPIGSTTPRPSVTPSVPPSPSPLPSPVRLYAQLSGSPIGGAASTGLAQYTEISFGSPTRRLEVFVRVNLPANTQLNVFVGTSATAIGTIRLSPGGQGELELSGNSVPTITAGTALTIKNGSNTVLSGTFAATLPSPSPQPSVSPTPRLTPTPRPSPSPRPAFFFTARMNGAQVVPAVQTQARGETRILLNQAENQIQVFASYFNLSSNQTGASINGPANPGSNAPQIFDLGTAGGTSNFLPIRTFTVTAAQVAQLRAGTWYVQIKSANHPNGEIRGQIRAFGRHGDFDGDGMNDLAVFRPSDGNWYFQNSSDNQLRTLALGSAGDKLVSGDYDGDGIVDAAVFKNVNGLGVWQVRRSSDDAVTNEQWGLGSDVPVAADFDGDGRIDLAVFRDGIWYIRRSSDNSFMAVQWGQVGDIPVAADFDGDGRDDIAVFRPSDGTWYALQSTDGAMFATQWGTNGDIPQIGDFDGDGIADVTVFRPSNGAWYIRRSIDGDLRAVQFGTQGDIPVAGSYDSDYLTDIAVFRPSNGTWYINRTVDNSFAAIQFGANGDRPAAGQ
jgi:hypothetical protein